jgi:hypothetical protein
MKEVSWEIEQWVPPENTGGGKGYWDDLRVDHFPFRTKDKEEAYRVLGRIRFEGRKVRLVKITREVVK